MTTGPGYLPLKELAKYAGVSVRTLRGYLHDPCWPLPYYQVSGGKVVVSREEFDVWMQRFRIVAPAPVDGIVDELLRKVS